jgi:hypothetical protein
MNTEHWWNYIRLGKPNYSDKTRPNATSSTYEKIQAYAVRSANRLRKVKEMWPMRGAVGRRIVGFVVDNAALEKVFLRVLHFSLASIIPPMLHTHSLIYHRRCFISAIQSVVK